MGGTLQNSERDDYWAATGVLGSLWKAELRGIAVHGAQRHADRALEHLLTADPSKSMVFSLCILRWCKSDAWFDKILGSVGETGDREVFVAFARAVHQSYQRGNNMEVVADLLAPVFARTDELGASAEQREVIDEF